MILVILTIPKMIIKESKTISTGKIIYSPIDFEVLKNVKSELKNYFQSNNYWAEDGFFYYFFKEYCLYAIRDTGSCSGNNPDTPYGIYLVKRAPGEYATSTIPMAPEILQDLGLSQQDNWESMWRMRSDEAIVMIALTPPESTYYSYLPYLYSRPQSGESTSVSPKVNGRLLYYAAMDSPLNNDNINISESKFNSPIVTILTADKTLDKKIIDQLKIILPKYGISTAIINTHVVPTDIVKTGYKNQSDDFTMLTRIIKPNNKTLMQEYYENPPVLILRIVPNTPENTSSPKFKFTPIPARETGNKESNLSGALTTLANAIKSKYTLNTRSIAIESGISASMLQIKKCISYKISCQGDNPDTTYIYYTNVENISNNPNDFLVVAGINHVNTNKAEFSNLAIYNNKYFFGIGSVTNENFTGSANEFTSYATGLNKNTLINNINQFYAYKIKRNCTGETYCYQLQEDNLVCTDMYGNLIMCPPPNTPGVDVTDPISVIERAYRDPNGKYGPSYSEIVAPKFIKIKPK